ncbi:MAG: hypothetical protein RR585_05780 [Coprobacillus sp.]
MYNSFPMELRNDVSIVLSLMSKQTYNNIEIGETKDCCTYILLDQQEVTFPYRIYYLDKHEMCDTSLTFEQKMIYHCIFSRSCDGFIREKHIKAILEEDYPDWTIPYILKISDEYVIEILESVYNELKNRDTEKIKVFCRVNLQVFLSSHDRMISYWNEYYRNQCYLYKNYVGKKLFVEYFGYTKSMEKERARCND